MATKPSQRPRAEPTFDGLTVRQIFEREKFDPLLELIRCCKGRRTVRNAQGEPMLDENGKVETIPLLEPRLFVEACKAMIEFAYPKLRTQEIKEQLDVKFTVTINRFEEPKKLEDKPAIDIGMVGN